MPKIPINNTKDRKLLRDEYLAHEENRIRDTLVAIRNRTMTKELYLKVTHWLRKFAWNLKQNEFGAGLWQN